MCMSKRPLLLAVVIWRALAVVCVGNSYDAIVIVGA